MTDVGTTPRKPMSGTRRLRIFEAAKGVCHICEQRIHAGEKWEADHIIPLALGGPEGDEYMAPAHVACHGGKTKGDVASIAKAKRVRAKHLGASRPKRIMPGSRASKWRKPFNGPAVLR